MMPSDKQWNELEEIFTRVVLDETQRVPFLIPIARAVDKSTSDAPFAVWLKIPGIQDFFQVMVEVLRRVEEPSMVIGLIESIQKVVLNRTDKNTLDALRRNLDVATQGKPTKQDSQKPLQQLSDAEKQSIGFHDASAIETLQQTIDLFVERNKSNAEILTRTIKELLQDAKQLSLNILKAKVLELDEKATEQDIAASFIRSDRATKLLEGIVYAWSTHPGEYLFQKEDAFEFQTIKELLLIHSLPQECRNHVCSAMRAAIDRTASMDNSGAWIGVAPGDEAWHTRLRKLIYYTWCILSNKANDLPDGLKLLLNPRFESDSQTQKLLRNVPFIEEPGLAKDSDFIDGYSARKVAQHLYNEYRKVRMELEDPVEILRDEVLHRLQRDGGVMVMFVKDKRRVSEFLKILNDEFPGVLCIYFSPVQGQRFTQVSEDVRWVDDNTPSAYRFPTPSALEAS